MKNNAFANYSINDFDHFDCLKLSKGLYFSLIYILRGYFVWLISVANMKDHTSFLAFVFPDKQLFYVNLVSGGLGLIVLVLISLRKPNAPDWVKRFWPKTHYLLIFALLFDLFITLYAYYIDLIYSFTWILAQFFCAAILIYYYLTSKRLAINLTEFPQPFDDK